MAKGKNKKKSGSAAAKKKASSSEDDPPLPRRSQRNKKGKRRNGLTDDHLLYDFIGQDDHRKIVDMDNDGNCLFRALSDQLYADHGSNHDGVRREICDYMVEFEDDFKFFLVLDDEDARDDEDGKDFGDYVEQMRTDGTWGGHLELSAAARLYRRNIEVFQVDSGEATKLKIEHGDAKKGSAGPDLLVSYHGGEHYNSVRDTRNGELPTPIKTFVRSDEPEPSEEAESASVVDSEPPSEGVEVTLESTEAAPVATDSKAKPAKVKKSAPCPCGSALTYKKCCLAKEKRRKQLERMSRGAGSDPDDDEVGQVQEADGAFRVLTV